MIRYEKGKAGGSMVAVFANGRRTTVRATRARSYPLLVDGAPDSSDVYALIGERVQGRVSRLADLGCGSGAGTASLALQGIDVSGIDDALEAVDFAREWFPRAHFEHRDLRSASLSPFDGVVMVDVLGMLPDDEGALRAVSARVEPGTLLAGGVEIGRVSQCLAPPFRRAYSPESLDALLVRSGWTAPTRVGQAGEFLVFECERRSDTRVSELLGRAASAPSGDRAEALMLRLALAAKGALDGAEARELLLALGDLQLASGDLDAAEGSMAGANAIAPRCARPLVGLARVALARGNRDDAQALLDHALCYDEANAAAWRELAQLFARRDELSRCAETLEFAAALEPADADSASRLASLLGRLGDAEGAARALARVLAFHPASLPSAGTLWVHAGPAFGHAPRARVAS